MIDQLSWLGKQEELEFRKSKFRGKNAGKIHKYSGYIDGLLRARIIIFAMVILIFYPVLLTSLASDQLDLAFFIERSLFSVMFLAAGLLFNKSRILAVILAAVPMLLLIAGHLIVSFRLYPFAFCVVILLFILSTLYYESAATKIKKELESSMLENQLVE